MLVPLFICPICQSPLQPAVDTWRCDGSLNAKQTSHPFDVARQGYVNLLPVQQKNSKVPGDSQQSIAARQRFLNAGYYQPLRDLVCQQMELLLAKRQAAQTLANEDNTDIDNYANTRWLDIGCGEGYYTQAMAQLLAIDQLVAADISKSALIELAKVSKAKHILWYQQHPTDVNQENKDEQKSLQSQEDNQQQTPQKAAVYPIVTSAAHLPLQAQSITGISSIFSPILPKAFAQALQSEGYLIIAKPDVGHLATVREALFDEVREHDSDKFLPTLAQYFTLLDSHHVSTNLSLSTAALTDLLTMTPYAYRAHAEKRQQLLATTETTEFLTEAKFVIYILQKLASVEGAADPLSVNDEESIEHS